MKLASWIYLMPFLFVYTPILRIGWTYEFLSTVLSCLIALVSWGAAIEGYLIRKTTFFERACLFISAFGLLHYGWVTDLIGVCLLVLVIILQLVVGKEKVVLQAG